MSNPSIPCSSDILPQHDLDERKTLGRATMGPRLARPPLWCSLETIGRGVWKLTHAPSGQSRVVGVDRTAFGSHDDFIDWANTALQAQADKLAILHNRATLGW